LREEYDENMEDKTLEEVRKNYEEKFRNFQAVFEKLFGLKEVGEENITDVSEEDLEKFDQLEKELEEAYKNWFKEIRN
jgi:dsDNA-specific endonuclease/ATPase MutS2